jgi:glycosyltransferase involved in cell wall biosynthesis
MQLPLVSIIIPCYRQAHFLPDALESVFGQSYAAIEPVVVNDGSDDNTDAVARSYGERIKYVLKPNGGLGSARNAGIRAASGDYLLFLDADDGLHPDSIAWLVRAMEREQNRLCIMGGVYFESEPPEIVRGLDYKAEKLTLLPRLIAGNVGPCHGFLSSKKMVDSAGGFDETFRVRAIEDWDLWLRLALRGADAVRIDLVGAYYRHYPGSMSTNFPVMLRSRTELLLLTHENLRKDSALLEKCAAELLRAAHRLRRRWIAIGTDSTMVRRLTAAINEVETLSGQSPGSWKTRVLNACLGLSSERLIMAYFRRFRPVTFEQYANDFH